MVRRRVKFADGFSGLGGWTVGARRVGWELVAAINHDPVACDYFERNNGHRPLCHEMAEVGEIDDLPRADVWLMSPACQGFSSAGQPARQGTGGNGRVNIDAAQRRTTKNRSTMWAVTSVAEVCAPQVIVVENSPRVYSWQLLPKWKECLEALGYTVGYHTLDSSQYGTPQKRVRAFISASRLGPLLLGESGWSKEPRRSIGDALWRGNQGISNGGSWSLVRDKPPRTRELIRSRQLRSGLRCGLLNNVGDGVRMRSIEEVAPTLTTKSGGQLMLVWGERVRMLEPRELARLQGWREREITELPEGRTLASKLIGNAVPADVAEHVCRDVERHLSND